MSKPVLLVNWLQPCLCPPIHPIPPGILKLLVAVPIHHSRTFCCDNCVLTVFDIAMATAYWHFMQVSQITNFQIGHDNNNFFQFSLEIIIAVLQYFTPHLLGQKVPISSLYLRNYSREGMKHLCCEIKHYLFSVTFTYQLSRNIPLNIYSLWF